MTDAAPDFRPYEVVVDALGEPFLGHDIEGEESPFAYSFSHQVDLAKNWRHPLLGLVEKLLDASFEVTLEVKIDDYEQGFGVIPAAARLLVNFTAGDAQNPPSLPQATEAFDKFQQMVDASQTADADQSLESVLDVIAELSAKSPLVQLWLSANLTKSVISDNIDLTSAPAPQRVTYYLFAKHLASDLEQMSLPAFEQNFCRRNQRSVIIVFDSSDFLAGDLLVICGRGHEDELKGWLTGALSTEAIHKTDNALRFRKSESFGDFHTEWLTPEFFSLPREPAQTTPSITLLRAQLKSFRVLLSVLFLADYIERSVNHTYEVEYRGIGVVKMGVDRNALAAQENYADSLFELYRYAYEGLSADKLEIVQQFISLITNDLNTLCSKATELTDAAKKTYASVLRNKVSVYFDALNKIQERLKTSVDKSAESVISLSRDVSSDVYKVVGIIAAAISVAFLKPDFGWSVSLAAALVLAVYMALVIFYHLKTLEAAYNLSMQQHTAYVRSFAGVLGRTKIKKFLADEHLKKARELFTTKQSWAVVIYTWCLVLSLGVATITLGYKVLAAR